MKSLAEQIVTEIKAQAEELNRLQYGEVVLKVQDGKLVKGDITKSWKCGTDSKNGRSER